jgi:phosphoribosylanthranilate isomerase
MPLRVKICGLTNLTDAQVAVAAGADLLGFILYPKSPRYCPPATVAAILAELYPATRPHTVGVFVNATAQEIDHILAATGLDLAQLHGDESPAVTAALAGRAYRALRTKPGDPILDLARPHLAWPHPNAPQLLLDAYTPDAYGGTGRRADWSIASTVTQTVPRLLLAGGLTPDNVQAAVAAVKPWGVDVSSGVEAAPGRKDHAKLRAFLHNARAATDSTGTTTVAAPGPA